MRISRLSDNDKNVFKILDVAGNAQTEDLIKAGASKTRIYNYQRDDLICRLIYQNSKSYTDFCYAWGLTTAGRAFAKKHFGIMVAKSVKNAIRHNVEVGRQCAKLIAEKSIDADSIISETDLRK